MSRVAKLFPTEPQTLPHDRREDLAEEATLHANAAPDANGKTATIDNLDERTLAERARRGDRAAFDQLMTRYRDRAIRLAAHVLRQPDEAEDVTQEAFLRAYAQIRQFRGDCSFYTWLYRIVLRCCLNRMRSPWWKRERDLMQPFEPFALTGTPEEADTRLLVETLLDRLPPLLRAALILREAEGLGYNEIAETLQVPVGTVRSRLFAARQQFRELWQSAQEEQNHV